MKHELTHNQHGMMLRNLFTSIKESSPVQWVLIREERIASFLYYLWLAGCLYWVYQLATIKATARPDWLYMIEDTREALMILFFGSFGLLYVAGIAIFICKFIYNLFTEGIESLFPHQWHSVARSLTYMVILGFSFLYIQNIKVAGLTAYDQVSQLMRTSEKHEDIAARNLNSLKELLDLKHKLEE